MALLRLFKPPGHQRYEYKPRFWNPEKEELKERLEKASGAKELNTDAMKLRISEHFARRSSRGNVPSGYRMREINRSNFRLALVLAAIIFIAYLGLVALPDFLALFE